MRTFVLIAASLFAAAPAIAQSVANDESPKTREEVEEVFASLDRNGDERISKGEAQREASLRNRFAGVDASGDGYVSKSEFRARPSDESFE